MSTTARETAQKTEKKSNAAPGFARHPNYEIRFEPCAKRVRVEFAGETIADSTGVMMLQESRHLPVYYFPRRDVRMDLLQPTDHSTFCPFKGDASYWSVAVGDKSAENAVWGYQAPYDEVPEIKDHMAFYWDCMDAWYEEDEEVFVHARDPNVRIDVLLSHRPVRVVAGGETIAETSNARFLFETNLPVRYYIPKEDVRMDLLVESETVSRCPYKGTARYWSVRAGEKLHEDVVWSYPDPAPEAIAIAGHLCFFNERVDAVYVDNQKMERPETKWSKGA